MILELIRLEENYEYGTFGVLKLNKSVFCVTLEPRDELNAPFISSIPAQQYLCKRIMSPKFGNTWEVTNVPEREDVILHPGNLVIHTEGCIVLAEHYGKLRGNRAVLNSGKTFEKFMLSTVAWNILHLTIKEVY